MMTVLIVLLLVAVALASVRLLRGPTDADRVVALDLLAVCAMAACALAAVSTGRALFLDVALGFALVAFVGTVAWARAVEAGTDHGEGER